VRLVVLLLIIGFAIALIIAWAFELTPEGIKRTAIADEEPVKHAGHRAWIYVVVIGAAFSVGLRICGQRALIANLLIFSRWKPKSRRQLPRPCATNRTLNWHGTICNTHARD
jgi:hypothetical protein